MERIAAFDNARATLLLLGVLFHSAVFVYLYQQPEASSEFLSVVFLHQFLHAFRMPAFFVIAGFFAAYLLQSRGATKFLQNRLARITLPLLIFWIPLIFANSWTSQGAWLTGRNTFDILPIDFGHLWFLYFLTVFVLTTWALAEPLKLLISKSISPALFLASLFAVVPLIPGVFDQEGTLATSTRIVPDLGLLLLYFLIFFSGVVAYFQRDRWLPFLKQRAGWLATLFVSTFFVFFVIQDLELEVTGWVYAAAVVSGTYGVLGLFLRFATRQGKILKFVADASYWIYLIHLPLVFFFLISFSQLGFGPISTILLTTLMTILTGFISYKLLVRHTVISTLLNGRRHPFRGKNRSDL